MTKKKKKDQGKTQWMLHPLGKKQQVKVVKQRKGWIISLFMLLYLQWGSFHLSLTTGRFVRSSSFFFCFGAIFCLSYSQLSCDTAQWTCIMMQRSAVLAFRLLHLVSVRSGFVCVSVCMCVSAKESVSLDYGTIKQLYAKIKKKEEVLDETLQAPIKKKKKTHGKTHTQRTEWEVMKWGDGGCCRTWKSTQRDMTIMHKRTHAHIHTGRSIANGCDTQQLYWKAKSEQRCIHANTMPKIKTCF